MSRRSNGSNNSGDDNDSIKGSIRSIEPKTKERHSVVGLFPTVTKLAPERDAGTEDFNASAVPNGANVYSTATTTAASPTVPASRPNPPAPGVPGANSRVPLESTANSEPVTTLTLPSSPTAGGTPLPGGQQQSSSALAAPGGRDPSVVGDHFYDTATSEDGAPSGGGPTYDTAGSGVGLAAAPLQANFQEGLYDVRTMPMPSHGSGLHSDPEGSSTAYVAPVSSRTGDGSSSARDENPYDSGDDESWRRNGVYDLGNRKLVPVPPPARRVGGPAVNFQATPVGSLRRHGVGVVPAAMPAPENIVGNSREHARNFDKVTNIPLRDKLDKFTDELFAAQVVNEATVKDLVKKYGLETLNPAIDAKDLARFVVKMKGKGARDKIADEDAAIVVFKYGDAADKPNYIDWVRKPEQNPTGFVAQRILLKNTQVLVKDRGVDLVKQEGAKVGLARAYDDSNYSDDGTRAKVDWLALGTAMRFEQVVHARHDKLTNNSLLGRTKDLTAYDKVSYNQFAAFVRKAVTLDVLEAQKEINDRVQTLIPDGGIAPAEQAKIDDIKAGIADVTEAEELIAAHKKIYAILAAATPAKAISENKDIKRLQARVDRRYLTETEALLGRPDKGKISADFTRGLSDIGRYDALFTKLAEYRPAYLGDLEKIYEANPNILFTEEEKDKIKADRKSIFSLKETERRGVFIRAALAEVFEKIRKDNPDIFSDEDIAKIKADKNFIFSLSPEQLDIFIKAVEEQSVITGQSAVKSWETRKAISLDEIKAARLVVKGYLKDNFDPDWENARRLNNAAEVALNQKINILEKSKDDPTAEEAALLAAEKAKLVNEYLQDHTDANDPVATAATPTLKAEKLLEIYRAEMDALNAARRAYQFKELADSMLGLKEFEDVDPSNSATADSRLYAKDGEVQMLSEGMKGDETEVTDTGLVIQVYKKNKGFEEHSSQFRALGDAEYKGKPTFVLSRFDERECGMDGGRVSENPYCLTTISELGTTNTFLTEATYRKLEDLSASKFKALAAHMAKVEGLEQIKNLMFVAAGDAFQDQRMDDGKVLVKRAKDLERLIKETKFSDADTAEVREEKIDKFNRHFDENLLRRQNKFNEMFAALDQTQPPQAKDIQKLNKFLIEEGIYPDEGFSAQDDWSQIAAKKSGIDQFMEDHKDLVTYRELPKSFDVRITAINDDLLSGKKASTQMLAKAKEYASHAVQNHLSNEAQKNIRNNSLRIKLDQTQVDDFVRRFSGRFEMDGKKPVHTGVDGSLWMNSTNKKDLTKLLSAPIPVSPVPGVSIFKPRFGDRGSITFRDKHKNHSNGAANFASVCFTADENGNFSGDDTAYVCLPCMENVYIKVMVARQTAEGKEKGQVTIYSDEVYYKQPGGRYVGVSTATAMLTTSRLNATFGADRANKIREAANKFGILATSVCGNERGSVAVMMNGASMENHLYNQRLSPFRDPKEPDRNISATFTVDDKGRIKADKPGEPNYYEPLHGKQVVARRVVEVGAFEKSEKDGILKDFKVVMLVCAVKKDQDDKKDPTLVKGGLYIETIDGEGNAHHVLIQKIKDPVTGVESLLPATRAELEKFLDKDKVDIENRVQEAEDLVRKADVGIVLREEGKLGKESIHVMRSTDDDKTWYGRKVEQLDPKLQSKKLSGKGVEMPVPNTIMQPTEVQLVHGKTKVRGAITVGGN